MRLAIIAAPDGSSGLRTLRTGQVHHIDDGQTTFNQCEAVRRGQAGAQVRKSCPEPHAVRGLNPSRRIIRFTASWRIARAAGASIWTSRAGIAKRRARRATDAPIDANAC